MSTPPRTPFNLSADPEKDQIRDKDNAAPEHKMKLGASKPRPNLAPGGAMGTRQGLPQRQIDQPTKRFALGKSGDLKREFKSIVSKHQDHEKGHDR